MGQMVLQVLQVFKKLILLPVLIFIPNQLNPLSVFTLAKHTIKFDMAVYPTGYYLIKSLATHNYIGK